MSAYIAMKGVITNVDENIRNDEDVAFEYEIQKTPQNILTWKRYIEYWKEEGRTDKQIRWLYERFCSQFVTDTSIWEDYIRWESTKEVVETSRIFWLFQRCLKSCVRDCDRICLSYLELAIEQYDLAMIRHALASSLMKMEREMHRKVWDPVIKFVEEKVLPLTQLDSTQEDEEESTDEAELINVLLVKGFTKGGFISEEISENGSRGDIWSSHILERYLKVAPQQKRNESLATLALTRDNITIKSVYEKYLPQDENSGKYLPSSELPFELNFNYLASLEKLGLDNQYEEFMRQMNGIYPDKWLFLILSLAKYYISRGRLDSCGDLLKKSLQQTLRYSDFDRIYNFYLLFEQECSQFILGKLKENDSKFFNQKDWTEKLQAHMATFESLINLYDIYLNDVALRQDSNLVETWMKRVSLQKSAAEKCNVYSEAILKIDPRKVGTPGSFGRLWCSYGDLYWRSNAISTARELWTQSLKVPYPYIEDLEEIYLNWADRELDKEGVERAFSILEDALHVPTNPEILLEKYKNGHRKIPAQTVLFNSLRIWSKYIDYLEAYCPKDANSSDKIFNKTKTAYNTVIDLRLITPAMAENFALFLQNHHEVMESFQVYEKTIPLFPPEIQYELWIEYLEVATSHQLSSLSPEHIRFLFEKALENLCSNGIDCKTIFIAYSVFEERISGLISKSIEILRRGAVTGTVSVSTHLESRLQLWRMCISKAESTLGPSVTRELYQECIQILPNSKAVEFVIKFSDFESSIGETIRAREILAYGAKLLPPSRNTELWDSFEIFELKHGDKETYKDMLKMKKVLESNMLIDSASVSHEEGNINFVAAATSHAPNSHTLNQSTSSYSINPDEIELDI
ncbi:Syf1p [Saccharomyces cerevisiae YJM326]|nr:Syf1p [Saccharomyces cerevisiae YJM326]AJU72237.1 Syf1p [Saccharomyces cerevisiae YJM682]CAI4372311.1 ABA_G0012750.mRNA.1.CDS.1 [Saccharomyces cerevisiae]CAI6586316.1 ABA_G0012750.mRNA.1.CDS.1 [Saccharomyces cerevisiae]